MAKKEIVEVVEEVVEEVATVNVTPLELHFHTEDQNVLVAKLNEVIAFINK